MKIHFSWQNRRGIPLIIGMLIFIRVASFPKELCLQLPLAANNLSEISVFFFYTVMFASFVYYSGDDIMILL